MQEYGKRISRKMKNFMPAFMIHALLMMLFARCNWGPPSNIGVKDGKLSSCPKSPNCVSTRSSDEERGNASLALRGSRAETMAARRFAHNVRTTYS